jgi:branched-subunit amino acid transport protein
MASAPDTTVFWALALVLGVATFAIRLSFIEVFHHVDSIPGWLENVLRYVPAAVLAAILVPRVVLVDGSLFVGPGNDKILAIIPAAVVAWQTDNLLAPIAAGMAALWILTAL